MSYSPERHRESLPQNWAIAEGIVVSIVCH